MSAIDHLPNIVFGVILQRCFVILLSFSRRKPCRHPILHSCNVFFSSFLYEKHMLS
jgi:hypothetical protein